MPNRQTILSSASNRVRSTWNHWLPQLDATLRPRVVRDDQLLVYLDQLYWSAVTDDPALFKYLLELVEQGRLVIPVSLVNVLETLKGVNTRKRQLAAIKRLAGGLFLVSPIDVLWFEFMRHRWNRPRSWLRQRLVTSNFLLSIAPQPLWARVFFRSVGRWNIVETFEWLADVGGFPRELLDRSLNDGASDLAEPILGEMMSFLAEVFHCSPQLLPTSSSQVSRAFPSTAVRMSLVQRCRAKGMEPNDIIDLNFLAVALPYFDVVTCDRSMSPLAYACVEEFAIDTVRVVGRTKGLRRAIERRL